MKATSTIAAFGLGLAVSVMPVLAHHSVPAQYDVDRESLACKGWVEGGPHIDSDYSRWASHEFPSQRLVDAKRFKVASGFRREP